VDGGGPADGVPVTVVAVTLTSGLLR